MVKNKQQIFVVFQRLFLIAAKIIETCSVQYKDTK